MMKNTLFTSNFSIIDDNTVSFLEVILFRNICYFHEQMT